MSGLTQVTFVCVHLPVSSFATEGEHAFQNSNIYTVNATVMTYHSTGLHSTSELFLNIQCSSVCETVSHHKGRDKTTEILDAPKLSECDT